MSHPITLLKQDHLIIKGHSYEVKNPAPLESYDCIELDFTIQVNGKMANFTNSFITATYGQDGWDTEIEWMWEWLLIVRILSSLGYTIHSEDMRSPDLLEKWAKQIKDADKEQE